MFEMNSLKRSTGKPAVIDEAETGATAPAPRTPSHERVTSLATIGPSICIKGELSGDEDLVIQGNVEGTVTLKEHNLTIGQEGTVNANIQARSVIVEGTLKGDILSDEKVTIRKTGNVHGNVSAPRISLEDGAKFKGSVDMDSKRSEPVRPSNNDTAHGSVFKLDNKTTSAKKASLDIENV